MNIAIIGTGTLGRSITQVFLQCPEIDTVYLCKGRDSSKSNPKEKLVKVYDRLVSKGTLDKETVKGYLDKLVVGTKDNAKNADFLIEAVSEDLSTKKEIFKELDELCPENCIFTTNTSSLPIPLIGEGLKRPLVGMHFFNPVPRMELVEIIVTPDTPKEIYHSVFNMAKTINKTPIKVNEAPGFIVNRILIPMINEAISIYAEGVSTVEDIDTAMRLGANHPMGPLALADLIGLDIILAILNTMLKETGDNRYLPQPMLKKMVRENKLGRKTGEGFYNYS